MNRRDFGRTGIAVSVGGVAGCNKNAEKPVEIQKTAQKTPKPYGIQYYEKARGIWDRISTSELPLIVLAADKAASSHKNGGKLYCQLTGGHIQAAEFRPDRRGNPNYLHNWSRQVNVKEFDKIGNGDFLFLIIQGISSKVLMSAALSLLVSESHTSRTKPPPKVFSP